MKRTAIIAAWLASIAVAYLAGTLVGKQGGPVAGDDIESVSPAAISETVAPSASTTPDRVAPVSSGPVAEARRLSASGELEAAVRMLEDHLLTNAHDPEALFLLSDLLQMTGRIDRALDPLFEIIRYPLVPGDAESARRRLELLINAREQQLINTGDGAGLVSFFERLVAAEPGYDRHRLKLAHWLLRSGDADEAADVFREVGFTGVSDAELSTLGREIELARTRLPVERVGGALYTAVSIRGSGTTGEYRMLIDTGATMTGLRISVLEALGATRLKETARVHTANGVTTLEVYRVRELNLGTVRVTDLTVLGLADLPQAADGLLGLDVLDRLSGEATGMVGMPLDPR